MSQQYFDQWASCKFPLMKKSQDMVSCFREQRNKYERKVRCKGLYFFLAL